MMRLPPTNNAEEIWAFKKGYRFAQQGKPLREMPFNVRAERNLKAMFEQGYAQGEEDVARRNRTGIHMTPQKRMLWLILALLAGLGTAKLMINEMQQPPEPTHVAATAAPKNHQTTPVAKTLQTSSPLTKASIPPSAPASPAQPVAEEEPSKLSLLNTPQPEVEAPETLAKNPAIATAKRDELPARPHDVQDFSLLDAEARAKGVSRLQSQPQLLPLKTHSPIKVVRAVLAANIKNREPVGQYEDIVPRAVRELFFFTEIQGAKGQRIIHRWRYGNRIMAEVPLKIETDRFRTWSSKRLTPAWAGRWWVEVVDPEGHVIARKEFRYVH